MLFGGTDIAYLIKTYLHCVSKMIISLMNLEQYNTDFFEQSVYKH